MAINQEENPSYLYLRGLIWWGRVRLDGKEYRYSLRTGDRREAALRMKAVRLKIHRQHYQTDLVAPGQRVYFIHDPSNAVIKVGFSRNVPDRLSRLQQDNVNQIQLLGSVDGTMQLEAVLHRFLGHFRRKGEWFKADPVVMRFVESLIEVVRLRL